MPLVGNSCRHQYFRLEKQMILPIIFQILDTYVTTQLMEEDRRFLTRRTGIIRQLTNPIYRQNIKYLASDVSRRCLVATVWSLPPPEIKYDPGKYLHK